MGFAQLYTGVRRTIRLYMSNFPLCCTISTADAETAVQALACLLPHDSHACVDMQPCMVYFNDELSKGIPY